MLGQNEDVTANPAAKPAAIGPPRSHVVPHTARRRASTMTFAPSSAPFG